MFFSLDRKDAEGWETVQRGRPVRSRSTALATKAPLAAESLKCRGDSDKENGISPAAENKHGSSAIAAVSENTELVQKDPLQHPKGPLTERTQVSAAFSTFF